MDAPKILCGEVFFALKLYMGAFNKHLYPEKHDYIYMELGFINFKLLYIQELKSTFTRLKVQPYPCIVSSSSSSS